MHVIGGDQGFQPYVSGGSRYGAAKQPFSRRQGTFSCSGIFELHLVEPRYGGDIHIIFLEGLVSGLLAGP